MDTLHRNARLAFALLVASAITPILFMGDAVSGCSATTLSTVTTDLGPGAKCALPIIVNGLISGTEVQSLISAALQCGGETIDGIIALVTALEGAPADAAPVAPAALAGYHLSLSQLHAALLARKAAAK